MRRKKGIGRKGRNGMGSKGKEWNEKEWERNVGGKRNGMGSTGMIVEVKGLGNVDGEFTREWGLGWCNGRRRGG